MLLTRHPSVPPKDLPALRISDVAVRVFLGIVGPFILRGYVVVVGEGSGWRRQQQQQQEDGGGGGRRIINRDVD